MSKIPITIQMRPKLAGCFCIFDFYRTEIIYFIFHIRVHPLTVCPSGIYHSEL